MAGQFNLSFRTLLVANGRIILFLGVKISFLKNSRCLRFLFFMVCHVQTHKARQLQEHVLQWKASDDHLLS